MVCSLLQDAADEMRRTYAFRCRMLPEACAFRSQSFGSEAKAKADMKRHLIEHVAAMCAASPAAAEIRVESVVARKRRRMLLHASSGPVVKMEVEPEIPPPPQTEPPAPPPAPVLVKQVRQK